MRTILRDFATLDGQELWNAVRLSRYLETMGSPFTTGASICTCPTLTAGNLGSTDAGGDPLTAYDTPATDPAPWYDASVPASAYFLGMMVLSIDGADGDTRARSVTNAVGGGGVFGPRRALPRTMTVTALLIGASCCAADYGLYWLSEALSGCNGDACDGGCLDMLNCCPDEILTEDALKAQHGRTFLRSAIVSGPTVTERVGASEGCSRGACGTGGEILQVEFVITAASPWAWTQPVEILDVPFPIGGSGDCIEWCLAGLDPNACIEWDTSGAGGCVWDGNCLDVPDPVGCQPGDCEHAVCQTPADRCADPLKPVPVPPQPSAPDAPFCIPLASVRTCYSIDLSLRPEWSTDVPVITITAGKSELRNISVVFYAKPAGTAMTCDEIADANRCNPVAEYFVTYIPAGGSVNIDGRTGRATTECGGECQSASTVFGDADGGPLRSATFDCAEFCVCLSSDPMFPPSPDAGFSLSVSGRGL